MSFGLRGCLPKRMKSAANSGLAAELKTQPGLLQHYLGF